MEDKKQDLNLLEELVKTADSYRELFANLADELSKVLVDIKAPDEEENTWVRITVKLLLTFME